jgi:hypothetical protein
MRAMNLFDFELRWFEIVGRTLLPPETLDGRTAGIDLRAHGAEQVGRSPWWSALMVRLALWLVWCAPLFVLGRPRSFGALDEAARLRCLEALFHSRYYALRETTMILKMHVCFALLGEPPVLRRLGAYDLARRSAERAL